MKNILSISDKTNGGIKVEPNTFKEMIRETFSSNQDLLDDKLNLLVVKT